MKNVSLIFWIGVALFAASIGVWMLSDSELLGWILFAAAFPLVFDEGAWRNSVELVRFIRARDDVGLDVPYDLKHAAFRLSFLYLWIFGLLAAREMNVLPDNGWTYVILIGPMVIWIALAVGLAWRTVPARTAK
jgi:hypothetical protein